MTKEEYLIAEIAGKTLKTLREAKGLTVEELAEQSGVSDKLIELVESGEPTEEYTYYITCLLSQPLGVNVSELYKGLDNIYRK